MSSTSSTVKIMLPNPRGYFWSRDRVGDWSPPSKIKLSENSAWDFILGAQDSEVMLRTRKLKTRIMCVQGLIGEDLQDPRVQGLGREDLHDPQHLLSSVDDHPDPLFSHATGIWNHLRSIGSRRTLSTISSRVVHSVRSWSADRFWSSEKEGKAQQETKEEDEVFGERRKTMRIVLITCYKIMKIEKEIQR